MAEKLMCRDCYHLLFTDTLKGAYISLVEFSIYPFKVWKCYMYLSQKIIVPLKVLKFFNSAHSLEFGLNTVKINQIHLLSNLSKFYYTGLNLLPCP